MTGWMHFRLAAAAGWALAALLPSPAWAGSAFGDAVAPHLAGQAMDFPSGAVLLKGRLYAPALSSFPVVIGVTGSGSEEVTEGPYMKMLGDVFTRKGIGFFIYNKRGVGGSGGTYSETDFDTRANDTIAAINFVQSLTAAAPGQVGTWGLSQAGWIQPLVAARCPGLAFTIMVSPAGVNPFLQYSFFLKGELAALGLSAPDIKEAVALHETIARYYATGAGQAETQAAVEAARSTPWFEKATTLLYWDEMGKNGVLPSPDEINARPNDFVWYRDPTTFADYVSSYSRMSQPTLLVFGGKDALVPVPDAIAAVMEGMGKNPDAKLETVEFPEGSHDIQIPGTPEGEAIPLYRDMLGIWAAEKFAQHQATAPACK
jgi:uncharacterized protein